MNRREFIKTSVAAAGATIGGLATGPAAESTPAPASPKPPVTVALPISVAPLAQRELDPLFEDMRNRAGVNTLVPFIYSHEPHRVGIPASAKFHGGNYATPHMQFYKDLPLTFQDLRAPEFGDVDVLERVIPVARKHGIRVFCFILEDNVRPATVPNRELLYEVDHHGRRADRHPGGTCYNNPLYQRFTLGLVEDYAGSYDIGGIMWGSERQSGLLNALGLSQSRGQDPGRTTCFCEFCLKKGSGLGINVERARSGFGEVEKFVNRCRAGEQPRDGFFAAFWRLLMQYPELLAWENLWVNSRHEFQAAIYARIKSVNPALQLGWHVWHNMSFSPFQRAEEDFAAMTGYSDFLRPALYNNVAGGRFVSFVKGAQQSVYGDLTPEQTLELLRRQLHYDDHEAPFDKLAGVGLSCDYVQRETRRAVQAVAGSATQIWPGVEIDVPPDAGTGHCTPESVGQAVKSAFRGGAHGIILSRNYMEMKPENLSGAGAALRELGLI